MSDIRISSCCTDMDIDLVDIAFPDFMPDDGKEFINVHGIDKELVGDLFFGAVNLGNGKVKIFHKCQHLADNGSCKIYNSRPEICRDFDCSSRSDCSCKGSGRSF